jgi:hypothetical protein
MRGSVTTDGGYGIFVHTPREQKSFGPQTFPHFPQLLLSPSRSKHETPQTLKPPGHAWHVSSRHTSFFPHALPHAPQWFGSHVLTQMPPHRRCVPSHTHV